MRNILARLYLIYKGSVPIASAAGVEAMRLNLSFLLPLKGEASRKDFW
jgi:hypothetical protein